MPVIEELDIETPEVAGYLPEPHRTSALAVVRMWARAMVAAVALFFFCITFLVQGYAVIGSCMEPNLVTGERVLGNKLIYRFKKPSRGDVVVFIYPRDPSKTYIKRVIALPGEMVEIRRGKVFINGKPIAEPYRVNEAHGDYGPKIVKQGRLFVLGDHRDQSNDSRSWGDLPAENVRAKAWIRYWPIGRLDLMR